MDTFLSPDGTRLAYVKQGSGLPLLVVHGTGGSSARWLGILPALAERFTVYALDRRGRGGSGDAPDYAHAREFEDIGALLQTIGRPVNLLGHSFGAVCALEAARLAPPRKLILYEPPIPGAGVTVYTDFEATLARLEALLAAGHRAELIITFMRDVVRMPAHELALFQASPAFPARLAAAHTLPRELRAEHAYRFEPQRFHDFRVPTALFLGGDSPPYFRAAISLLAAHLPASPVVVLPGHQHIAIATAPELFVAEVVRFLEEP
jgi:pimeloyl-ACP methyl ester carboxylesterase